TTRTTRCNRIIGKPGSPAAVSSVRALAPSPDTLLGRSRHSRNRRRRLLVGANRIQTLAQRIHQIDHLWRRFDFWRDDLSSFDLGVDDVTQADLVVVAVLLQVDLALESAHHLM